MMGLGPDRFFQPSSLLKERTTKPFFPFAGTEKFVISLVLSNGGSSLASSCSCDLCCAVSRQRNVRRNGRWLLSSVDGNFNAFSTLTETVTRLCPFQAANAALCRPWLVRSSLVHLYIFFFSMHHRLCSNQKNNSRHTLLMLCTIPFCPQSV